MAEKEQMNCTGSDDSLEGNVVGESTSFVRTGGVVVLISTIDGGIDRLVDMLLPEAEDIRYVVSHQYTSEAFHRTPAGLERPDVRVSHIAGRGVARSRNHALDLCPLDAEIALFADDDGVYERHYIDDLKQFYAQHPEIDLAGMMIETFPGERPYSPYYPTELTRIENPYLARIASAEMSFRPQVIRHAGVRFDTRFGAGSGFIPFGEETVFVSDCLKAGIRVWFSPQYIVRMHCENTIKQLSPYDARRIRVLGAVDMRIRGMAVAVAKTLWFAIRYAGRIRQENASPWQYMCNRLSGMWYILRTREK